MPQQHGNVKQELGESWSFAVETQANLSGAALVPADRKWAATILGHGFNSLFEAK